MDQKIFQISDEQCILLDLFTFCVDRFLSSYMYKTVTEVILVSKTVQVKNTLRHPSADQEIFKIFD